MIIRLRKIGETGSAAERLAKVYQITQEKSRQFFVALNLMKAVALFPAFDYTR